MKIWALRFALVALLFGRELCFAQTTKDDTHNKDQLAVLIKEVRAQQADLSANQAKIDEKLAAIAEAIRQARIYASRGGK